MARTPAAAAPNTSSEKTSSASTTTIIHKNLPPESANIVVEFFSDTATPDTSLNYNCNDFYSHLICDVLKADLVQHGRISCTVTVQPSVTNDYNGLHGGAIASIAERLAIACARTVVALDKQLFLGELSMSYLSVAAQNEVLAVDGSVVRSGRNLTVVAIEFRIKKTQKPVYLARATLYHMPASKL